MRFIGRLLLVALALSFAIAAGAVALAIVAIFDPLMANLAGSVFEAGLGALLHGLDDLDDSGFALDQAASGLGRLAFTLLVLPVAFVALAGEAVGARSLLWNAGGTALVAALVPWLAAGASRGPSPQEAHVAAMLALVGAASGFVYWLIAGRSAGPERNPGIPLPPPGR